MTTPVPDLCPLCNTASTAFADWQTATEEYKRAMDAFLKPDASVRHAVTEATLALERRSGWAVPNHRPALFILSSGR